MRSILRSLLVPLLLCSAALPRARAASAQSVADRSPNLSAGWTGSAGTGYFNFLHRFEHGDAPARKVSNYPTFLMGYTVVPNLLVAANYATNSDLVPGYPNEWEFMGRWGMPLGRARVALTGAYNLAAESVDGETLVAVGPDRIRLMGVARAFSQAYGDDGRVALGGGGVLKLHPNFALAGDVVTLLDREAGEEVAWSAGAQIRIPSTPHSISLHVTNTNTATLQGSSRGGEKVRGGFEFTVPITFSRWFGGRGVSGTATDMTSRDTVVVTIRDFEFSPANVAVRPGATVVWVNEGAVAHTATTAGAFDTGLIQPRARASHTFAQAGSFDYLCTPHPFMKGRIVVGGGR